MNFYLFIYIYIYIGLLGVVRTDKRFDVVGVHADRCGSAVFGGVQWEIGRLGMGVAGDRGGGQLRDLDVAVGIDAGSGSLHVRHRTVQCGPSLVR